MQWCVGCLNFTIRVVPEYVCVWGGGGGGAMHDGNNPVSILICDGSVNRSRIVYAWYRDNDGIKCSYLPVWYIIVSYSLFITNIITLSFAQYWHSLLERANTDSKMKATLEARFYAIF